MIECKPFASSGTREDQMINKPRPIWLIAIIIASISLLLTVVGCGMLYTTDTSLPPTQTVPFVPTPTELPIIPHSSITLPDGSKVLLMPDARVQVVSQPGIPPESQEISVMLLKGSIMVVSNLASEKWLMVQKPNGYTARMQGCAMVVDFDDALNTMHLTCIGARCQVSPDFTSYRSLTNDLSWSYQGGFPFDPAAIDYEKLYLNFSDEIPACVAAEQNKPTPEGGLSTATPEPTYTPTPTIDIAATATQACSVFHQQFPATPCP